MGPALATHTWSQTFKHWSDKNLDVIKFSTPERLTSHIDPEAKTVPMDVQDDPEDRHSLVHHSFSTYQEAPEKGRGPTRRREAATTSRSRTPT